MNKGTLASADSVIPGEVADDLMEMHNSNPYNDDKFNPLGDITQSSSRFNGCFFHDFSPVAIEIKKLLRESKGINAADSHDLTLQFARESIPVFWRTTL